MKTEKPIHIVIVDDDQFTLEVTSGILRSAGYRVTEILSAADAQKLLLGDETVDMVLLDYELPPTTGLDIIKKIKAEKDCPFILITHHIDDMIVENAARLGALGYIIKPFNENTLKGQVRIALLRGNNIRALNTEATLHRHTHMATGIISERYKISLHEAYEILRATARSKQQKVSSLAEDIIEGSSKLEFPEKAYIDRVKPL